MNKIDVDIYLNQFKKFFNENPDSLKKLIGNINEGFFFKKVEEISYHNLNIGEHVSLTRKQLIDIVVDLNKKRKVGGFKYTKFGFICLN